jgi:hypothetical protein
VIGVILGPMADENLRRALMVSQGSFMPIFQRPVSLILFYHHRLTIVSQFDWYRKPGSFHGETPAKPYSMKAVKTNKLHLMKSKRQRSAVREVASC